MTHQQLVARSVAAVITASVGFGASTAYAEEQVTDDENTVVITASRFKEESVRLPTNITIISKEDIERSNATQVVQLLKRVAGIQISSVSGKTTVSMRGISAEQASNNVLIQVDGRRLNYTDIAAPDLESVLVSDIERIEIIQGAASTLYGDQAVAGVINIITHSGKNKESNASLTGGSYGTAQANLNLNHALNQDWSFLLSANYLETDNYRDHNEREQSQLALKFHYLTEMSDWLFEFNTNHEDLDTPGALLEPDLSEPTQSRPEFANDYVNTQQDVLRVFGQETIDNNWKYAIDVNYLDSDIDSINSFVGFPTTTVNTTDRTQWSVYPRIKGQWQTDSGSIDWTNGVDYDHAEYAFSLLGRSNEQEVKSLYSQLFIPLSKRTDIEVAARYARVEDDLIDLTIYPGGISLKNSATAYDIGVSHQFDRDSRGYVRYSDNYRFAKVDEQSYTADGVIGLEPQTGHSLELGYERGLKYGFLKLSAYRLELDDEIFFDPAATPPPAAFFPGANVNGGRSERIGLMVDYQAELTDDINSGVNYHYVDAEIKRGEPSSQGNSIPGVSEHTANAWIDWQIDSISNGYLEVNYRSDRYQEGDVSNTQPKIASHTVLNSAINWSWEQLTLGIRVDNLLDKEYIDYAQFGGYYPANGRYGYVKLSYRF
ncbi:TonB-dependent receptor [Kangiella marina]|uniref:TonB-dependent receptor n=1 Tax=Kangiella marina TaxID=1079178 RepID=A0ABP8IDF2_9GAMM